MGIDLLEDFDPQHESFSEFGGLPVEIDRYKLLGRLGMGSMGVVLRAHDEALGRDVALKLLRLDAPSRTDLSREEARAVTRARFVYEARLMARLSHANVVPIYDVGTWEEHVFIAMELVDGETLDVWLRHEHSRAEVLDVFRQAAEGLAAAHRAGVVHRDFKPNNVIVGRDGRVRVMDFGLAKLAGESSSPRLGRSSGVKSAHTGEATLTQVGMSVGTPAYMPPEQHNGRCLDGRSDQFAFCSTLHQALHGVRPFEGSDPETLLRNKLERRLRRARRVPRWLTKIIERGTAPRPEDRFESMLDVLDALRRVRRRRIVRRSVLTLAVMAVLAGAAVPVVAIRAAPGSLRHEHHTARDEPSPSGRPSDG